MHCQSAPQCKRGCYEVVSELWPAQGHVFRKWLILSCFPTLFLVFEVGRSCDLRRRNVLRESQKSCVFSSVLLGFQLWRSCDLHRSTFSEHCSSAADLDVTWGRCRWPALCCTAWRVWCRRCCRHSRVYFFRRKTRHVLWVAKMRSHFLLWPCDFVTDPVYCRYLFNLWRHCCWRRMKPAEAGARW